jgi:hypothetical protein
LLFNEGFTIQRNAERYNSIDDRRPVWARNGKLPVAYRRANLRLELAKHGILAYRSPEVTKKLGNCSLAELRRIHTYAAGGVQGSVNVRLEEASDSGTLTNAYDTAHTATIARGEPFLSLDFRPYNVHHKNEHGTAATYFLFQDLGLTIDALRAKDTNPPELIVSSTNRAMARLAVRRAGFALHGARIETGNRVFEFSEQTAVKILNREDDDLLQAAGAEVELNAFMTTDDFLSERNRTDYANKATLLQKRLAMPNESLEQTEARLRTDAIRMCLVEMRATDALRLARYPYRRDLIEPLGDTVLSGAQQQIATWQPQIEPDGFVLPDYYAK